MPWLPTSPVLWLQVADQDDYPVLEGLKGDVLGKATDHRAGSYMGGEGRDAILEGLTSVVPREVLVLHTWAEMEEKVCGNPEVSVQALKKHTIYDSDTSATDARVQTMWSALERFTNEERSQFLRFINRLSCIVFVQTMRQSNCLPRAATCSNALYLPEYSSVDMAYKKLLYAAYNCMAIDTDS